MTARRALVCTARPAEYDREGGSRRVFHIIELLQELGWAVSFLAHDATGGERYARLLRQRGVATYAGPDTRFAEDDYLPDPERLIAVGQFDLAILIFWNIAEYYLPLLRALSPTTRVVADSVDLHFLRNARSVFSRRSEAGASCALTDDYGGLMTREINTYAAADAVLTVSQKEAEYINDLLSRPGHAQVVPLMEDFDRSPVPFSERRGILFLGNFRHPPNIQAAEYLFCEIVPRLSPDVLRTHPILVVGNNLGEDVTRLARGSGIRPVGWVPSVVPYLHHARVSVIPLLHGAGTKTKLIQALMAGTPSVSTCIGVEGLGLRAGEHVLVSDDPTTFAQGVSCLLEDEGTWEKLATEGHGWAAANHGLETVRARLQSAVLDLSAPDGTPRIGAMAKGATL